MCAMMTERSSRPVGSPEGGAPASLGLIRGGFLKKGKCELSFKELLHPLTSPPTPSCVSLFTVLGACQICFLPQGLCTRYPFCLDYSSLDIQVAALSLHSDLHLHVTLLDGASLRAITPLPPSKIAPIYTLSPSSVYFSS